MRRIQLLQPRLLGTNGLDERIPSALVSRKSRCMHESADVRDAAFDGVDAEVAAREGVEVDGRRRRVRGVVPLESEIAMRPIASERAFQLLIEAPPASPRADDHRRANLIERSDRLSIESLCAIRRSGAQQQIIEE